MTAILTIGMQPTLDFGTGATTHWMANVGAALTSRLVSLVDAIAIDATSCETRPAELAALRALTHAEVVIIAAPNGLAARMAYLNAGADEVLSLPMAYDEVTARVVAAAGRARTTSVARARVLAVDGLEIDLGRRRVTRNGFRLRLSHKEWAIIELLARHEGRVVPRDVIYREVWGRSPTPSDNVLRVFVRLLRRRVERLPGNPRVVLTDRTGYRLGLNSLETPLQESAESSRSSRARERSSETALERARRTSGVNAP